MTSDPVVITLAEQQAQCRQLVQAVDPTGPGNTIEGWRPSCGCGWRCDLFATWDEAQQQVGWHLGMTPQADARCPLCDAAAVLSDGLGSWRCTSCHGGYGA